MARYIDADALISEMAKQWENNDLTNNDWCFIRNVINCTPTAVVRCKDCVHYNNKACRKLHTMQIKRTDFCSFGERRM